MSSDPIVYNDKQITIFWKETPALYRFRGHEWESKCPKCGDTSVVLYSGWNAANRALRVHLNICDGTGFKKTKMIRNGYFE